MRRNTTYRLQRSRSAQNDRPIDEPSLSPELRVVTLFLMEQHELTQRLAQLHQELSQADHVDPENLELLCKLTDDIGRLVGDPLVGDGGAAVDEDAKGVGGGLKNLLLKFEADHPELSNSLGKVADALAAIGI